MKILMVSMNSIHFKRWVSQLENSGHEVYWFNVYDSGYSKELPWVKQYFGWKKRFGNFKGRHRLKSILPQKLFSFFFEKSIAKAFKKVIEEIQPDCVHSFALYVSCKPIETVMDVFPNIKWIYSSWGSDLFLYGKIPAHKKDISKILPKINFLFTDCNRDYELAKKYGFTQNYLGTYPGGGGFRLSEYEHIYKPLATREIILVKGYENRSGRAINIIKALQSITDVINLNNLTVVIYGATQKLQEYLATQEIDFKIKCDEKYMTHFKVLGLMGQSLIAIGNSNSDGMPNTLLESICMGAFPIQSNPGGASEDVIINNRNGLLIQNCNDAIEISNLIKEAINNKEMLQKAFLYNQNLKSKFDYKEIRKSVLEKYLLIENEL